MILATNSNLQDVGNKIITIGMPIVISLAVVIGIIMVAYYAIGVEFLFEMTKRIRKYNGILYIMKQNINDFMGNENIKTQAQGIINNCLYQCVHHLAPSDLQDYDNLISASGRLNEYQKSSIASSPTGTCLFSIGSKNLFRIFLIKLNTSLQMVVLSFISILLKRS